LCGSTFLDSPLDLLYFVVHEPFLHTHTLRPSAPCKNLLDAQPSQQRRQKVKMEWSREAWSVTSSESLWGDLASHRRGGRRAGRNCRDRLPRKASQTGSKPEGLSVFTGRLPPFFYSCVMLLLLFMGAGERSVCRLPPFPFVCVRFSRRTKYREADRQRRAEREREREREREETQFVCLISFQHGGRILWRKTRENSEERKRLRDRPFFFCFFDDLFRP